MLCSKDWEAMEITLPILQQDRARPHYLPCAPLLAVQRPNQIQHGFQPRPRHQTLRSMVPGEVGLQPAQVARAPPFVNVHPYEQHGDDDASVPVVH